MTTDEFDTLARARAQWRWRGKDRPQFAGIPLPEQISVWNFPRPPELVREVREIVVRWGALEVARTCGAWAVRETAHPPTFYLPLADVQRALLRPAGGGSFCEWKDLRDIGIWSPASGACHRSPGAIRSPWQGQNHWLSALPFMRTTSIAA
jgi:hypothetical protein